MKTTPTITEMSIAKVLSFTPFFCFTQFESNHEKILPAYLPGCTQLLTAMAVPSVSLCFYNFIILSENSCLIYTAGEKSSQ